MYLVREAMLLNSPATAHSTDPLFPHQVHTREIRPEASQAVQRRTGHQE